MKEFYIEKIEKTDTLPEVSEEALVLVGKIIKFVLLHRTYFTDLELADLKYFSIDELKRIGNYLKSQLPNTTSSGSRTKRDKIEFILKVYRKAREAPKYRVYRQI